MKIKTYLSVPDDGWHHRIYPLVTLTFSFYVIKLE